MRFSFLKTLVLIFTAALILSSPEICPAKKRAVRLSTKNSSSVDSGETEMARGSFMVASHCEDCNNGYTIDRISFSGYDKPQSSRRETFLITNNTDRMMTGLTLYIDYRTPDGRQLHKKFIKLSCRIPAGETRQAEIASWDTQSTYYYHLSRPSRNGGAPYTVVFDPVAYYLQF